MLVALLCVPACDDDDPAVPSHTATSSQQPQTEPPAVSTVAPPATDLASRIGPRGDVPHSDPIDLAARYGLTFGRAPSSRPFSGEAQVGDTRQFNVLELNGGALAHAAPPRARTVAATLLARTAHAYFYAEDSLGVAMADMDTGAAQFEAVVWPAVTGAFGEPAIPGVDGDPRIVVLQADLGGVGGYVVGDDGFLRGVRPISNEAEMIYLDATVPAGGGAFDAVLAHELQHLIHARNDSGEEAWVNEGLSEDATLLLGGSVASIDSFERAPSTQLNFWDSAGAAPHYGAGAAFFRYLTSRFGGDALYGAFARTREDGPAGVDAFLNGLQQPFRFRDVFADWIVANIVNDESGPYANPERPLKIVIENELVAGGTIDAAANQFGADYYTLVELGGGDYGLRFDGDPEVAVLPPSALERGAVLWSNTGDEIDSSATYQIDLVPADGELTFSTWYDIEPWFDWGYVSVSNDGGATWQALAGEHTSTVDPARQAYGPGYTGRSGGAEVRWVEERVDLGAYTGQDLLLRFEHVTDGGTHGEGWAIRDLHVVGPAGEVALRRLEVSGWVEIDRPLQQTYVVRLILRRIGGVIDVLDVPLDANARGELAFSAGDVEEATLVVAGATEGTNQPSPYTLELRPR